VENIILNKDSQIINNNKNNIYYNGGGINILNSNLTLNDSSRIAGNAAHFGGGIYATDSEITLNDNSKIIDNTAIYEGGGIYNEHNSGGYNNIIIGENVIFSGNTAQTSYRPPVNAIVDYPNIKSSSTSIFNHLLNNYDINYLGVNEALVELAYDSNGGIGFHKETPVKVLTDFTVLAPESIGVSHPSSLFIGWNTKADGSGDAYTVNQIITMTNDITLYAQWKGIEHTLSFDVNHDDVGGIGPILPVALSNLLVTVEHGEKLATMPTDPSRVGYVFMEWNLEEDGSGLVFDENFEVTYSKTVYAQWQLVNEVIPPTVTPPSGNVNTGVATNSSIWIVTILGTIIVVYKLKNKQN
jgi:uncharacterized repeat protein (TIGR02543 family)